MKSIIENLYGLSEEQCLNLKKLLNEFQNVFSK